MKKKILSLFLTASLILSGQAGWILQAAAQDALSDPAPAVQEEQEQIADEQTADTQQDSASGEAQTEESLEESLPDLPQDESQQDAPSEQIGTNVGTRLPSADKAQTQPTAVSEEPPFWASIDSEETTINTIKGVSCGASSQEVLTYEIVIPQGVTAKEVTVEGLADEWSCIKNSCTGDATKANNEYGYWEPEILPNGEYYHMVNGDQVFHIAFQSEDAASEPSEVELELDVSVNSKVVTVNKIENTTCDGVHKSVTVYEIVIPQGTTAKNAIVDGLTNDWSCIKNSCTADATQANNEYGYWEPEILPNGEYYHMVNGDQVFHIVFRSEGSTSQPSDAEPPFDASANSKVLKVNKIEDKLCEANYNNVPVYQIVIPADTTAKEIMIDGLTGWSYTKNGCTGGADAKIGEEGWAAAILPRRGHYHVTNKNEIFHIVFDFEGEEIVPDAVPIPFTAKAGETDLTVSELPTEGKYPACSLKHIYEITVPSDLKDETIVLNNLKGFYYRQVKSDKSCYGGTTPIADKMEVKRSDFGYHVLDNNNVSQNPEYKNFHVVFKVEEALPLPPQPPQSDAPFTAKAENEYLKIVKKPGAAHSKKDLYTVMIPIAMADRAIAIEGLRGFHYSKNTLIGSLEEITENTWTITAKEGDWYKLQNFNSNLIFEINFNIEKEPEPEPDQEVPAADAPFTAEFGGKNLSIFKVLKPDGFEGTACQKNTYRIRVPESGRGKDISVKGLEGSKYAKDQCDDSALSNISADWKVTAAEKTFYHVVTAAGAVLHIEFTFVADEEKLEPMPPADPTIPSDFENDLWLQYDFKEMKVGETADIYPRRVPQLIDSAISNNVTRPVFHFEVLYGSSIELSGEQSRDKVQAKAVKNGTTIVAVTYDAEDSAGASSRVNTAYVVYDVNDTPAEIEITTDISKWRSYDTIYFTEGDSVALPMTVQAPGAEKIEVTCNGHVLEGSNGEYTLPLENKSNIIGIKATDRDGRTKSRYQVIDARKIEIILENVNDPNHPVRNNGEPFQVNDKVRVSFRGITIPVYKLASIYNPCFGGHDDLNQKDTWPSSVVYQNKELGNKQGELHGFCHQWDLATSNSFVVTLKEEKTYLFEGGHIKCNWWGSPLGSDKDAYGKGDPNFAAPILSDNFSTLPDFEIHVGKSDTVKQTEEKIAAIGTVTLDKEQLIRDARAAYEKLSDGEKPFVKNYDTLIAAEKKFNEIKDPNNAAAINAVIDQIHSIKEVTLQKEGIIKAARKAYEDLPQKLKEKVTNLKDLEAAEKRLEELQKENADSDKKVQDVKEKIAAIDQVITLQSEKAITEARKAYETLSEQEKLKISAKEYEILVNAEQQLKDLQAAKLVDDKIAAIGVVTLKSKIAIKNAREAYEHLSTEQKKLVKNLDILVKAEKRLAELEKSGSSQVDWVMDLIDSIGKVTLDSEDDIKKARSYYNRLKPQEKDLVKNYSKLLKAERELKQLKEQGGKQAGVVIDKIKQIGTTITLSSESLIQSARRAYDALSDAQKKLVTNLQTLLDAEKALKQLKSQSAPSKMAAPAPNAASYAHMVTAPAAQAVSLDSASASQINQVINQLPMTGDAISPMAERTIMELFREYSAMSEAERAQVDYESLERSMQALAEINQQDARSGITISNTEWFVKLDVSQSPDLEVLSDLQEKVGSSEVLGLWDITPVDIFTGDKYHPQDAIQVSLPLNQADTTNLCIVHYDDEGNIEYIKPQILGSNALFETKEFSNYAVVRYEDGNSPFDLNSKLTASTGELHRKQKSTDSADKNVFLIAAVALLIIQSLMILCLLALTLPIIKEYYFKNKRGRNIEK